MFVGWAGLASVGRVGWACLRVGLVRYPVTKRFLWDLESNLQFLSRSLHVFLRVAFLVKANVNGDLSCRGVCAVPLPWQPQLRCERAKGLALDAKAPRLRLEIRKKKNEMCFWHFSFFFQSWIMCLMVDPTHSLFPDSRLQDQALPDRHQ